MPRRSIRRARNDVGLDACRARRPRCVQLDEALDAFARLGRHLRRLGRGGRGRARGPACAAARPGSRARGRPGAARSADGRARARPRRRPAGRRAGASRPARRAPRRACRKLPPPLPRAACPAAARARSSSRAQVQGYAARPRSQPGYALGVDVDRLGHSAADRRADRRLAPARGRARRGRRAARHATSPSRVARLQRPRPADASCRRWRSSTARLDRGEPADDAPDAGAAHRAHGRARRACSPARCAPPRA